MNGKRASRNGTGPAQQVLPANGGVDDRYGIPIAISIRVTGGGIELPRLHQGEEDSHEYILYNAEKVNWEYKFVRNCAEIVEDFEWAQQLAEAASSFDRPSNKFKN